MTAAEAAASLHKLGIKPVPIEFGTKNPVPGCPWGGKDAPMPSARDVQVAFSGDIWVAAQSGPVSGNLECIDFDDPAVFPQWCDVVKAMGLQAVLDSCYVQQTPSGGFHVAYRVEGAIGGNQKLARRIGDDWKAKARIETRSDGGYFLVAPSRGYKPLRGHGTWGRLPVLPATVRRALIEAARSFDEKPKTPYVTRGEESTVLPGKDYDSKTSWADILEPAGWKMLHEHGGVTYWQRPGKSDHGVSATTNFAGSDLLYVFSSNADPFEAEASYSKFAAYSFIHHGGDMREAARSLAAKGFGGRAKPTLSWNKVDSGPVAALKVVARRKTLADFEPEEPKFLFDDWKYLRDEQVNLIDAKGGTGKTSLILCLGAMGSKGISPGGGQGEPFTTLYYGSEDSGGELRASYDEHGGDPSRFVYVPDILSFDRDGIDTLHDDLEETGAKVFVLDAAKYYLPGGKGMEFDAGVVADFMARMREAAREHHATCVLLRHFARNTKDRDLLDQGAGIEQWYSSCRSNLVSLKHPTKPGNAVVCHAKGSLRSKTLPPFGCGWSRGVWGFWKPGPEDLAHFGLDEDGGRVQVGRPPARMEDAKQFICDTLRSGGMRSGYIVDLAKKAGISRSTLFEAKAAMGSQIDDRRGYWQFDPYSD